MGCFRLISLSLTNFDFTAKLDEHLESSNVKPGYCYTYGHVVSCAAENVEATQRITCVDPTRYRGAYGPCIPIWTGYSPQASRRNKFVACSAC